MIEYFILGGIVFLIIFIIIFYLGKKFRKILEKKYIPETANSFKCLDGHVVRSKGELIIDNYLFTHQIKHIYEEVVKVNGKSLKCDWYLPDIETYVEYWGYYGKKYFERRKEKISLYKRDKLNLISIEDVMFKDIYSNLDKIFENNTKIDNNKKYCPNCGIILDDRF
jgi:predicted nuclease of restriction endonuclease-like RecB superfamily